MRLRNIRGSQERIEADAHVLKEAEQNRGSWRKFYGDENPLHLEIGMGKGQFLMEMAKRHPDIHFIGIEKYSSVMIRALEKLDESPLPNIHLLRINAELLCDYFDAGEVDRIYLNFSDPWPKERHARRRLTSREYLSRYARILKPGGEIVFKTDNQALFDFSLAEARDTGWAIRMYTRDLHHSPLVKGNVMTEYEEKFVELGHPIYKMILVCP